MNRLDRKTQKQVVAALVEGMSIRAISRMVGISKTTVTRLLCELGQACGEFQDRAFRQLDCSRLECDEIWSFCHSKQKNVAPEHQDVFGFGDVWVWVALDAVSKLVPCWLVGPRNAEAAEEFITDLASRLTPKEKVQLTTDGHRPYLEAVEKAFGGEIDFAQLIKVFGSTGKKEMTKYSPAPVIGARKHVISGNPRKSLVSTSYVERQNLTMRMSMRRFTRLTNGFSKKVENHAYAVAVHYMYYNFVRIHQSLRCTPAMAAGVTSRLWEIEDMLDVLNDWYPKSLPRGPYKKRDSK